jgi:hypothetical protein
MAVYRRRLLMVQLRPLLMLFAACLLVVSAGRLLRDLSSPTVGSVAETAVFVPKAAPCEGGTLRCGPAPDRADRPDLGAAPPRPPIAVGASPVDGVGRAALTNIAIAISFIDGAVLEPGERWSFDDTARTWDFREDSRYVPGPATSARGLITMRGGGVCWLSTAIWRAALDAGLATEFRENHMGIVPLLGAGYDATNTLVVKNDATIPLKLRVWLDDEQLYAAFYGATPLDRSAEVRGPVALGYGRYALYQDITWGGGTQTTAEFYSHYYW